MINRKNFEVIKNTDFTTRALDQDAYEQVEFVNCQFSDLAAISFIDCVFMDCNLSNASVANARFSDVAFVNCKLTGIHFSNSKDFGFSIQAENCILDYAIFERKKPAKSSFTNCKMHGADFTQADLSKCRFHNCDFWDAVFANTNVSGVDFTTSKSFTIDPTQNNVRKAKFLSSDLSGLLTRFDIIVK